MTNPIYLVVCCCAGLLVFFSARRMESRYKFLVWLDAIGLSVLSGAHVGLSVGLPVSPGRGRSGAR